MHADETQRGEPTGERCHRFADEVSFASGMQRGVVIVRGDPVDLGRVDRTAPIDRRWRLTARTSGPILPYDRRWESESTARMRPRENSSSQLLPGTLDMLVLKALRASARHGYGIAQRLRETSGDVLHVGESSLYPALQRLLLNGWVTAKWGASENNRRARYYTLTAAGREQLAAETIEFQRMIGAIQRVLRTA